MHDVNLLSNERQLLYSSKDAQHKAVVGNAAAAADLTASLGTNVVVMKKSLGRVLHKCEATN